MFEDVELDADERHRLAESVLAFTEDYLERLADTPASWPPIDDSLVAALARPPSEAGSDIATLLSLVQRALQTGIDTSSGKFLSYIPSGGIYSAAMGRLLGAITNRYTGGTHGAPGLIALEHGVVRWMCRLFDLPSTASGVLFSGGSIANLTATVAARARLGEDFSQGVVYTSERAHHSITKAARIAGIRSDLVRLIPADPGLRLNVTAMRAVMRDDIAAGLRPMLVAATAGTTDTGTIDPLAECAEASAETGAWFHVDAAYGGFFALTERGKERLAGIELADSITVDAHKSLFMPFGVGGVLVRDEKTLIDAHEGSGSYMQDVPAHATAIPNYFAMGPELTRPARGLEVWLALHLHGVAEFRDQLDGMLDLAAWTAKELAAVDGIEVSVEPALSIVAFKSTAGNAVSEQIAQQLNATGEVHVSTTTVGDEFMVRLAFLSQRTSQHVASTVVQLVRRTTAD